MITKFVKTQDGIRLAYDVTGSGPVLVLLHGAGEGHTRQSWHEAGYVDRLKDSYTVCLLYTSPSPRDQRGSRMPSSA